MKAALQLQIRRIQNDVAGCLAAAAEYEATNPTDPRGLLNAAYCRAACATLILKDPNTPPAEAERLSLEQADLAIAWLKKAVVAGYNDPGEIKRDESFDVLRDREEFKKLLANLERAASP